MEHISFFLLLKRISFTSLFLAVLGPCYCAGFSLVTESRGSSSLVAKHRL